MNKVEVFVISNKHPSEIKSVTDIFSGKSKKGLECSISVLEENVHEDWDNDYAMTVEAFDRATPGAYVIICKDKAITGQDSNSIMNAIDTVISEPEKYPFDLFYMGKWLDKCELYSNYRQLNKTGMNIVDTISPNGILCIMFSPEGRDKFMDIFNPKVSPIIERSMGQMLKSYIGRNEYQDHSQRFRAITTSPNIVSFNIRESESDRDFVKANECSVAPPLEIIQTQKDSKSSYMYIFWFVICIIAIVLIAVVVFRLWGSIFGTTTVPSLNTGPLSGGNPLTGRLDL